MKHGPLGGAVSTLDSLSDLFRCAGTDNLDNQIKNEPQRCQPKDGPHKLEGQPEQAEEQLECDDPDHRERGIAYHSTNHIPSMN